MRPSERIGSPAKVVEVNQERSQTGFVLTVVGPTGVIYSGLDQDWFEPHIEQQSLLESHVDRESLI